MAVTSDVPPPPIVCVLSEHREGSQFLIAAEIRSSTAQAGTYRLSVVKRGPAGSTQINQQSEFSITPQSTVQVRGLSLSLEPQARYQARLSIQAGDAEYACEQDGPAPSQPL